MRTDRKSVQGMHRIRIAPPWVLVVSGALATSALAASLRVSPIGVDIPSTSRAAAITIANTDSEPVNLQIRIYKWTQAGNEENLEPSSDILVSPPSVAVPPGASYTIRVARPVASPVREELSYRLLVDELPQPEDPRTVGQGVRMVLRTSMPVFIADKAAVAHLSWSVWQDDDGIHAQVVNSGRRHAKVAALTLQPADGPPIAFGSGLNGYVLAGATKRFDLKIDSASEQRRLAPGSSVVVNAKNDALDIQVAVTVTANAG